MELFYSDKYFVLQNEDESLWVNRENGAFSTKKGREAVENNLTLNAVGKVYGLIGVLRLSSAGEPRLVFIRSQELVCKIKEHPIYRITSVVSVPLESECELDLEAPSKSKYELLHSSPTISQQKPPGSGDPLPTAIFWNRAKIPACPNSKKYGGRVDRTERRLLDEYCKMFIEADSFYYSNGYDIFNSLQRQTLKQTESKLKKEGNDQKNEESKPEEPGHQEDDERFFWNQYMLSDILSKNPSLENWTIRVLQGSIQHATCELDPNARISQGDSESPPPCLDLILLSRRSRYRAGTRYLKRGVDDQGKVANYVETEQIVVFRGHMISFVQTRGSVPVFWSQPGYKYRPPIRLDKSVEEGLSSFEKHMDEEVKLYGSLSLVNLVEKNGREKVLEEAYRKCVLLYNSEHIEYITFDFHDKCRGLKFDNVKLLTEGVADTIKSMAYCWVDSYGMVMQQIGTFRVNCVDCLDRTNVVQSFLAREVLSLQMSKIGLLLPEVGLSESIRKKFLEVWANNGDIISKQYAGTNALKGDFTRTGERKFAGVMRDGMNSANRYLNNRLKDGTRQACIDLILGVRSSVTEEELTLEKEAAEEKEITTELIMQTIEDVRHCLVPAQSIVIGSWGLVNAKTNEVGSVEIDTVLVLTESDCFVALYDWSLDTIASSTKISLSCVTALEIINEPIAQSGSSVWGLFHASNSSQSFVPSLKLLFVAEDDTKDFFHFRSSNLRFFNNCLTHISHPDEMMEALRLLGETIKAAVFSSCKKSIPYGTVMMVPVTAITPPKSTQKGAPGINAWIPRWNTGTPPAPTSAQDPSAESISRKFNPASMQRFTPNFLKKKRTNADEEAAIKADVIPGGRVSDLSLPQSLKVSTDPSALASQPQARTPMETGSSGVHVQHLMDLFLPSCGIVSVPIRSAPTLQIGVSHEVLADGNKTSPGMSPVTPIMDGASQDVTPTSTDTNPSLRLLIPPDLLSRHRFSLPTNSLGITVSSPIAQSGRSTTPEIRITEEPSQNVPIHINLLTGGSALAASINQKRMSRSSEDINKVAPATPGVKMFNSSFMNKMPVTLKHKLVPSLPQDSRSTSDQDIFSSLVHMKGSHSESAIKDGNSNPAQKRDVVFAPLGKLARGMQSIGVNYLDPRKLRDTLRQPRQEIVTHEDPEITEMMKSTKSRIIDI